jgi:hypothetical protein
MTLHKTLQYLSLVMAFFVVTMLCCRAMLSPNSNGSRLTNALTSTTTTFPGKLATGEQDTTAGVAQNYVSRLVPGILSATPGIGEMPTVDPIPWSSSDVKQAYAVAEYSACQMLVPNQSVQTSLKSLATGQLTGGARIAALTLRLAVDEDAEDDLPATTKNTILSYLRDHEIAISPMVHQQSDGKLYFGGDCRAAFYATSNPEVTVKPEPLIEEAIGRIRILGVLGGQKAGGARTLVLAMRYARTADQLISQTDKSKYETELLFLHLASDATVAAPGLSVFVTSDGRRKLHRLNPGTPGQVISTALLLTTVRFDSYVMMGIYPASPVVTGVLPYKSVQLPVDTLLRSPLYTSNMTSMGFELVLDHFAVYDDADSLLKASYSANPTK